MSFGLGPIHSWEYQLYDILAFNVKMDGFKDTQIIYTQQK